VGPRPRRSRRRRFGPSSTIWSVHADAATSSGHPPCSCRPCSHGAGRVRPALGVPRGPRVAAAAHRDVRDGHGSVRRRRPRRRAAGPPGAPPVRAARPMVSGRRRRPRATRLGSPRARRLARGSRSALRAPASTWTTTRRHGDRGRPPRCRPCSPRHGRARCGLPALPPAAARGRGHHGAHAFLLDHRCRPGSAGPPAARRCRRCQPAHDLRRCSPRDLCCRTSRRGSSAVQPPRCSPGSSVPARRHAPRTGGPRPPPDRAPHPPVASPWCAEQWPSRGGRSLLRCPAADRSPARRTDHLERYADTVHHQRPAHPRRTRRVHRSLWLPHRLRLRRPAGARRPRTPHRRRLTVALEADRAPRGVLVLSTAAGCGMAPLATTFADRLGPDVVAYRVVAVDTAAPVPPRSTAPTCNPSSPTSSCRPPTRCGPARTSRRGPRRLRHRRHGRRPRPARRVLARRG
jgi:hypothetical protein